jgi:hypothetical protein
VLCSCYIIISSGELCSCVLFLESTSMNYFCIPHDLLYDSSVQEGTIYKFCKVRVNYNSDTLYCHCPCFVIINLSKELV